MSVITKEFDRYNLTYYSSPEYSIQAVINCYKGTTATVGLIYFHKDGSDGLPANYIAQGLLVLNYPASFFKDVMTILLHEKPLALAIDTSSNLGWIGTLSHELIGEEEPPSKE